MSCDASASGELVSRGTLGAWNGISGPTQEGTITAQVVGVLTLVQLRPLHWRTIAAQGVMSHLLFLLCFFWLHLEVEAS